MPPNWLFGPVWTLLYATMGVAAFLVWRRRTEDVTSRGALMLFGVQLVLNGAWSFAFCGARSLVRAHILIAAPWGALAWTTERLFRIGAVAGWLLVPYVLWVTYVGTLNIAIWILN